VAALGPASIAIRPVHLRRTVSAPVCCLDVIDRQPKHTPKEETLDMSISRKIALAVFALLLAVPAIAADVRMYVRHDVADYAAWRKVYNGFDAERRGLGVTGDAVYQAVDNANDVTVWHDFKSIEVARAFASSEQLKTAMKNAGVKGPPQIWFVGVPEK
jgi:hypothetical protein